MTATDERAAGRPDDVTRTTTAAGLVIDIEVPRIRVTASGMLDERDAATYLGSSVRKLQRFRKDGCGPRYRKVGGRFWYPRDLLDEFLRDCEIDPLAEK